MSYYTISIIHYNFPQIIDIAINIHLHFPIMLALCLMLLMTYYAQTYAGIIGRSLVIEWNYVSIHGLCQTLNQWWKQS